MALLCRFTTVSLSLHVLLIYNKLNMLAVAVAVAFTCTEKASIPQNSEARGYFWNKYSVRHCRNKSQFASPNNAIGRFPNGFMRRFTRLWKIFRSVQRLHSTILSIDRHSNLSHDFDSPSLLKRVGRFSFPYARLMDSRIFAIWHLRFYYTGLHSLSKTAARRRNDCQVFGEN